VERHSEAQLEWATQGNLGGASGEAHERRLGEGRAIAEAGNTLERDEAQESIELSHRVTPSGRQRAREREQGPEGSR
jgi:hypothetical protein